MAKPVSSKETLWRFIQNGVTEPGSADGEEFGEQRLLICLKVHRDLSSGEIVSAENRYRQQQIHLLQKNAAKLGLDHSSRAILSLFLGRNVEKRISPLVEAELFS